MDLKITHAHVVNASEEFDAEIGIHNGTIVALAATIPEAADETLDASGTLVIPGGVDPHTHLELPLAGTVSADDWASGTVAAACGGTTTIIDYADQDEERGLVAGMERWHRKAEGRPAVDYAFHMMTNVYHPAILAEVPRIVEMGIPSFKCFLAYRGRCMFDDEQLFRFMRAVRHAGGMVNIHAENGYVIDVLTEELLAAGQTGPQYHAASRPTILETEATYRALCLAELVDVPVCIVHISSGPAAVHVGEARRRGLAVVGETCPQYLLLDATRYDAPDFEPAKYVMSPPLRPPKNRTMLWEALQNGDLQMVATDHCPFNFRGQKDLGRDNFTKIPNGAAGVETRMVLLFSEGVVTGALSRSRFVELTATAPAKIFGLFPRKGTIAVGSDADIVLWDPEAEWEIRAARHHQRVDYTPFEGWRVTGAPRLVLSRGRVVAKDGEFCGRIGHGQFVPRQRPAWPL